MGILPRSWRFCVLHLLTLLTIPFTVASEVPAQTPEPETSGAAPAASVQAVARLGLAECLQIALDKQPNLAAARASLAAAEAQRQGLHDLRLPAVLLGGRELPIRRKQAAL